MTRLASELGITTQRCAFLTLAAIALFVIAMVTGYATLYGLAVVAAFAAGATWERSICCDECGSSLEQR